VNSLLLKQDHSELEEQFPGFNLKNDSELLRQEIEGSVSPPSSSSGLQMEREIREGQKSSQVIELQVNEE
jgi:hypothetical protein